MLVLSEPPGSEGSPSKNVVDPVQSEGPGDASRLSRQSSPSTRASPVDVTQHVTRRLGKFCNAGPSGASE
eukprot:14896463-Alexandrium_andersonii.AAC.1